MAYATAYPGCEAGGTPKAPLIGAVERGWRAIARSARNFNGQGDPRLVKDTLEPESLLLITGVNGYAGARGPATRSNMRRRNESQ